MYVVKDDNLISSIINSSIRVCTTEIEKQRYVKSEIKTISKNLILWLLLLINMHSNMVMTLYDIKMIHVEPKDQNKSTRDNQAYLRMNSETQTYVAFVKQMIQVTANNFDDLVQTLVLKIVSHIFSSPSTVLHLCLEHHPCLEFEHLFQEPMPTFSALEH